MIETPVLIVGAGPVGLGLAIDLGWRSVPCVVVEREDGTIDHPRANAENARTMEFFRRWGIAGDVRRAGVPRDAPQDVVYATSLTGYEIARIARPGHGGGGDSPVSPERPQRCNQLWLDPILRDRAASFPTVSLRYRSAFASFERIGDRIEAVVVDRASGEPARIAASYLVDCSGGRSGIAQTLGIELEGPPAIEYNLNVFLRCPELIARARVSPAAMYFFVEKRGISRTLVDLNGRGLWRLGFRGKDAYDEPAAVDVAQAMRELAGADVPFEELARRGWVARDLVAARYGDDRIFLAGDAAHQNTPSGGFGMNTGLGDAVDLGWKLAAMVDGWGGAGLPASYERERRPVARRNVDQATQNFLADRRRPIDPAILDPTPDGERVRAELGETLRARQTRQFVSDGTALGYRYDPSPLCVDDGTPPPPDTITQYVPSARPGARAPHVWIAPGRSIIDLFGRGFVLLRLGAAPPDVSAFRAAFARARVPLTVETLPDPAVLACYERSLVLVRPDGHVAWRGGDDACADEIVDVVRGAQH